MGQKQSTSSNPAMVASKSVTAEMDSPVFVTKPVLRGLNDHNPGDLHFFAEEPYKEFERKLRNRAVKLPPSAYQHLTSTKAFEHPVPRHGYGLLKGAALDFAHGKGFVEIGQVVSLRPPSNIAIEFFTDSGADLLNRQGSKDFEDDRAVIEALPTEQFSVPSEEVDNAYRARLRDQPGSWSKNTCAQCSPVDANVAAETFSIVWETITTRPSDGANCKSVTLACTKQSQCDSVTVRTCIDENNLLTYWITTKKPSVLALKYAILDAYGLPEYAIVAVNWKTSKAAEVLDRAIDHYSRTPPMQIDPVALKLAIGHLIHLGYTVA